MQSVSERLSLLAEDLKHDPAVVSFLPDGSQAVLDWAELERRTLTRASALSKAARQLGSDRPG